MRLTPEEQAMLAGEHGEAVARAMRIVVTLGRIYEAEVLLPVKSVQVAGVSYRNLGQAGLEFLQDWAAAGARVRVPTTLNPAGTDLVRWQQMGADEAFWKKQTETVDAYAAMGIQPTCTCTPYLVGNTPEPGDHVAWSESSAVSYANSVLGARTNREGGPSALAAAIVGRTAAFGLHLDANRTPTLRVELRCDVKTPSDYAALGYLVGREVKNGIPYFVGLEPGQLDVPGDAGDDPRDKLKLLGAALAASGAVALYHVQGVTPEARSNPGLCGADVPVLRISSLDEAYAALNCAAPAVDLVVIGCPHASLAELAQVALALRGKKLITDFWVTTSRAIREQGLALGYVSDIERAGGAVLADGCVVVAPMQETRYKTLATNSAKMASYALPHAGLDVHFGPLDQCVAAAVNGYWTA